MAIYFVGEYPVLFDSLKNKALVKEQVDNFKISMDEVRSHGIT